MVCRCQNPFNAFGPKVSALSLSWYRQGGDALFPTCGHSSNSQTAGFIFPSIVPCTWLFLLCLLPPFLSPLGPPHPLESLENRCSSPVAPGLLELCSDDSRDFFQSLLVLCWSWFCRAGQPYADISEILRYPKWYWASQMVQGAWVCWAASSDWCLQPTAQCHL